SCPLAVSQSFTVPSQLAEAIRLPSRLQATPLISAVWPRMVSSSRPVVASHIRTMASLPTEARRIPSALNSTRQTASLLPDNVSPHAPLGATQEPDPTPPPTHRQPAAIRTKAHATADCIGSKDS